jgi:protein TonB
MLETLLESRLKRERSIGGAFASVTAHTALVAAALYATAQAHVETSHPPDTVYPVHFPQPTGRSQLPQARANRTTPHSAGRLPVFDTRISVDIKVPPFDISEVMSRSGDFSTTPAQVADAGQRGTGLAPQDDGLFRSDQVEKQVEVVPGSPPPRYPEVLRSSGVEGRVLALFVVNERGSAEEESVRFLRSDNKLFEDAVKAALRRMRFIPAEVNGKKVRQLVQMPFVFTLSR